MDVGAITSTSGTDFQAVSGTDLCSAALNQSNMFDASAGCNPTLNGWYSADGGLFYYYTGIQSETIQIVIILGKILMLDKMEVVSLVDLLLVQFRLSQLFLDMHSIILL